MRVKETPSSTKPERVAKVDVDLIRSSDQLLRSEQGHRWGCLRT